MKNNNTSLLFPIRKIITKNQAFTLIELIVVMALMSIVLYFAIPRMDINIFSNDDRNFSTWLIVNVKSLREKAQRENSEQILYVDLDNDQLWPGSDKPSDQTQEKPQYKLPDGMRILDVEYPNIGKKSSEIAEIHFYPQGYSDKAIIHIEDNDGKRSSYLIEPFLSKVKIEDGYIEFDNF